MLVAVTFRSLGRRCPRGIDGTIQPANNEQRSGAYHRISFEQAITDLLSALNYAKEGLQELETSFHQDIAPLRFWLPPSHVDFLWLVYTAWDGLPANIVKHPADLKVDGCQPLSTTTYAQITHSISNALSGLRQCSPPDALAFNGDHHGRQRSLHPGFISTNYANSGAAGLDGHVLRTTMRMLEISFEAIEGLVTLVGVYREMLAALRHKVRAVVQLLAGMPGMKCGGKGKGKAVMGDG